MDIKKEVPGNVNYITNQIKFKREEKELRESPIVDILNELKLTTEIERLQTYKLTEIIDSQFKLLCYVLKCHTTLISSPTSINTIKRRLLKVLCSFFTLIEEIIDKKHQKPLKNIKNDNGSTKKILNNSIDTKNMPKYIKKSSIKSIKEGGKTILNKSLYDKKMDDNKVNQTIDSLDKENLIPKKGHKKSNSVCFGNSSINLNNKKFIDSSNNSKNTNYINQISGVSNDNLNNKMVRRVKRRNVNCYLNNTNFSNHNTNDEFSRTFLNNINNHCQTIDTIKSQNNCNNYSHMNNNTINSSVNNNSLLNISCTSNSKEKYLYYKFKKNKDQIIITEKINIKQLKNEFFKKDKENNKIGKENKDGDEKDKEKEKNTNGIIIKNDLNSIIKNSCGNGNNIVQILNQKIPKSSSYNKNLISKSKQLVEEYIKKEIVKSHKKHN